MVAESARGSARSVAHVALLAGDADGAAEALGLVVAAGDDAVAGFVRLAARHHLLLRALRRLAAAGVDLDGLEMEHAVARDARLTSYLRGVAADESPFRLSQLLDALERHARLLHQLLADLGRRHPGEVAAVYGMALRMAYTAADDRQSSDLDIYVRSTEVSAAIRHVLEDERGYQFWGATSGVAEGRDLQTWTLVGMEDDHAMHVDCMTRGRPSAGHQWIPPFRGDGVLARSRVVTTAGGGSVLVPAPEDMLLMAAEKVQRKGDFSLRRVVDAGIVVSSEPALDWEQLIDGASTLHIRLGLHWLLRTAADAGVAEVPAEVLGRVRPAAWERRFESIMAADGRHSRRARSLHRLVWVSRYVVHHPHRWGAAREIRAGRFTHFEKPAGVETWGR